MLKFKQWLNEVNLTFSQFLKRTHLNLNRFYEKVKKRELFETEDGKQIKLLGIAIKQNNNMVEYHVKSYTHNHWVETITSVIEDSKIELSRDIFVILANGTLKPLSILSKSSTEISMKTVKILDATWGALNNLRGLKKITPRRRYRV